MKVLFLDVDGVLNTWAAGGGAGKHIKSDKLMLLRKVCKEANCHVVVSSMWRTNKGSRKTLSSALNAYGIPLAGYTPDLTQKTSSSVLFAVTREKEIQEYLNFHTYVESFVILDDMQDLGRLQEHLVSTNPDVGLTGSEVERIIKKFNEGDQQE